MERTSRANSFLRRRSSSLSDRLSNNPDDDGAEIESVSEAGDIGDRALSSRRHSESGSIRLSYENASESGSHIFPISEDVKAHAHLARQTSILPVTSLPEDLESPASMGPSVGSRCPTTKEPDDKLPSSLEYISCLIHLAVFGILGVLTRYLLQKLFGPSVADVTSDQTILYLDLPSNMVGSFLMGWFGVVFKADISRVSNYLAIGLTTGYLGSLTTFSGWNQKMLDLSVAGRWVFVVLGFLVGMFLVGFSIIFGIETAKGFRCLLSRINTYLGEDISSSKINWNIDSWKRQLAALIIVLLMLGSLWGFSGGLLREEFHDNGSKAELWLACLVGPLGVWIRWILARVNGRGLGKAELFKWIPFGTLLANVSAACVMAALSAIKRAVHTRTCNIVATGLQFGLMGCLSTVSTFAAEFHAMRESTRPWRAYAYATITILISFVLGTLIYSVPVWTGRI